MVLAIVINGARSDRAFIARPRPPEIHGFGIWETLGFQILVAYVCVDSPVSRVSPWTLAYGFAGVAILVLLT